jgi:hypothetical protein
MSRDMWCPNCSQPVRPRADRGWRGWLAWLLLPFWWLVSAVCVSNLAAVLVGWELGLVSSFAWSLPVAPLVAHWVGGWSAVPACPICRTRALKPTRS